MAEVPCGVVVASREGGSDAGANGAGEGIVGGQVVAAQAMRRRALLVSWLCGVVLDSWKNGLSVAPARRSTKELTGLSWRTGGLIGMRSECGAYLRLSRQHRESWVTYLYYEVLTERPASPQVFLSTMQASLLSLAGRSVLSSWEEPLANFARRQMFFDVDGRELDEVIEPAEVEDAVAEAFSRVRVMSWAEVEAQGELSYRRIVAARDRAAALEKDAGRQQELSRIVGALVARDMAPEIIREVMREAGVTPIRQLSTIAVSEDLKPAWTRVLARLGESERAALMRRFSLTRVSKVDD